MLGAPTWPLAAAVLRAPLQSPRSADDWTAVIDTNLSGAYYTARPALRGMLRRRAGSIVAVSSVVGITGNAGQVNYAAAKAGMIGMVFTNASPALPPLVCPTPTGSRCWSIKVPKPSKSGPASPPPPPRP
jgi:NAD(P)-dependent dehydrogenase (short-subunit alcohol dehydrogenase family)